MSGDVAHYHRLFFWSATSARASRKMSGKAGHPAYFDPQDQKAYMKQPTVFQNKKEFLGKAGRKAAR